VTKFCRDCKWATDLGSTPGHPAAKWACGNEQVGSHIDVVDGRRIYVDCHTARRAGASSVCRPEGIHWEERK